MEKITSFTINHLDLEPGVYVSRKDPLLAVPYIHTRKFLIWLEPLYALLATPYILTEKAS